MLAVASTSVHTSREPRTERLPNCILRTFFGERSFRDQYWLPVSSNVLYVRSRLVTLNPASTGARILSHRPLAHRRYSAIQIHPYGARLWLKWRCIVLHMAGLWLTTSSRSRTGLH